MCKILFFFIMTSGLLVGLKAQNAIIPLYTEIPPGNKDIEVQEKWATSGSGSATVTQVTIPELWQFSDGDESPKPAIIICPGGGYRYEAYEHEGKQVAQWLSELGFQAFVLKYRLPDEDLFENSTYVPLADARNAIALIRKDAKKLGVNPHKVGIMGFSAGGHLAGSASVLFNHKIPYCASGKKVRPDFSILIYPVISMTDSLTHKGSKDALLGPNASQKMIDLFSLEKQVTSATPPTFILHAVDDRAVPPENTINYAKALREYDIPVREIILPEGGHGFGFRKESPAFEWTEHLAQWLNENIK
jgi:acetyl esterase/lipase